MRADAGAVAARVVGLVSSSRRAYAVFVGRSVELVPADGALFARLGRDPGRMALCAGVFDVGVCAADVEAAMVAFGGVA